jgi:hypothetical protein
MKGKNIMAKFITSTTESTVATVRGINPETEKISEISKTLDGTPSEMEIKIAFFSPSFMPLKVLESIGKTEKRRMTFEKWISKSEKITDENKKDKGKFITRTTKYTVATVRGINPETEQIDSKRKKLLGLYTEEESGEIKRLSSSEDFMAFKVSSLEILEEKRRMSFDEWMNNSEVCGNETPDSE